MEWNDETKPWLKGILSEGEVTITFTKKDGTDRTMRCTRKADLLPVAPVNENTTHKQNDDVLPVYDLDASGWRSFRWDSIKEVIFS